MDGCGIKHEYTIDELAELLADLEFTERRQVLEAADLLAATHY